MARSIFAFIAATALTMHASTANPGGADCSSWLTLSTGQKTSMLERSFEGTLQDTLALFSDLPNPELLGDALRVCFRDALPSQVDAIDAACTSSPSSPVSSVFHVTEPLVTPCYMAAYDEFDPPITPPRE